MGEGWQRDAVQSAKYFCEVLWIEVSKWFSEEVKLYPVEEITPGKEYKDMFDMDAGIDYWVRYVRDGRLKGIASRVQYGGAFDSFTIRDKRTTGVRTEYEKRKRAIETESLYPFFTVQGYVDKDKILSLGGCKTKDLIEYIEKGIENEDWYFQKNSSDGNIFRVVNWDAFEKKYPLEKFINY